MTKKRKQLEDWQIEDANRLKAIFDRVSKQDKISQEEFGGQYDIGSQGMVWQYLNARTPLNLQAAIKFAVGLDVNVGAFSPTLEKQLQPIHKKQLEDINQLRGYVRQSTEWQEQSDHNILPNYIPSMDASVEDGPVLRPFKDVPVVGTVQGGKDGFLEALDFPTGHGDGAITYPAKDQNSYAVRVRGDSMRPRIKAGEFIVVEPNHEAQPGDDVVVTLRDGQRMVKEYLYERDDEVTLGSINNGHGNITVQLSEIEKIHYVAAIIPRGAFYKP